MKRWWIGYTGSTGEVCEVEVIGQRNPEASWGMSVVRLPDAHIEDVRSSDLHETEQAARRGRALSEAEDLEEEARERESGAEHHRDVAADALVRAEGLEAEARALRARAKALRDAIEAVAAPVKWVSMDDAREMFPEVKDATEGRR